MQELLGRLSALDPAASQSLRVIACFDELIAGDVGVRGLLSAAAALSGRTVGLVRGDTMTRVDHRGEVLSSTTPPATAHCVLPDTLVWIETSTPDTESLDVLIVERLSLALLIRLDSRRITPPPRALTVITDHGTAAAERRAAALRLGLHAGEAYRVIVAPLFASWRSHPRGPEDVVATACGPVHTSIVTADASAEGTPSGLGSATAIDELDHSFRTAMIALRLHDGSDRGTRADDFGGLADLLADLPEDRHSGDDLTSIESVMRHPWGARTIEALVGASSVREAARAANIHHSTMADRLTIITTTLKFNPVTGIGRTRLGLAYLQWRHGDAGGTRALIDVLLLHRSMAAEDVIGGITAALTVGAVTADVVAVEARRHETLGGSRLGRHPADPPRGHERRVVSLTQRRLAVTDPAAVIAGLPPDRRPLPSVAAYDQLLRLPERPSPETAVAIQEGTAS